MSSVVDNPGTIGLVGPRRGWSSGTPPRSAAGWVATAIIVSVFLVIVSWNSLAHLWSAAATLKVDGLLVHGIIVICGLAVLSLIWPALQSFRQWQGAKAALAAKQLVEARVATAASLDQAHYTLGFAAALLTSLLLVEFFITNNLAVSRTFFLLPLIGSSFWLIVKAFWINIYIFITAEILVLIWGLVVAVARLTPGKAGRPIRAMATIYTDVFRGFPAIINIYLIGFGLPLTGIPWVKDFSQESFAILALTLSYGAYVAEVYRAGIESIHRSQVAAARSLGLSYLQTLRYVVVPQAMRRIIPPLLNDFIGLQKDTALVNVIGSIDAFNQAKIVASNHFNLSPVTTVAFLFILITIPQARFVDKAIERDQRRMLAGGS